MSGSDRVRYVSVVEDMEEGAGGDEAGNSPESSLGHGPESEFSAMFGNLLEYIRAVRAGETPSQHPSHAWLEKLWGLSKERSAGTSETAPATEPERGDSETRLARLEESNAKRLDQVESSLRSSKVHMVLNEVKDRELVKNRRERDREIRAGMFSNEYQRQNALDLFDVQTVFDDTWEAARVCHPELLGRFQTSVLQGTVDEVALSGVHGSIDVQNFVPLVRCLAHVHAVLDKLIHYGQMAATSKVGWREMREYLSSDERCSRNFTGSQLERAGWAQFQKTAEAEILKDKAHSKALAAIATVPGSNRPQGGVSKSAPPSKNGPVITGRQARNRKNRMKYRKRKAAQKAQKAKADATAAGKP